MRRYWPFHTTYKYKILCTCTCNTSLYMYKCVHCTCTHVHVWFISSSSVVWDDQPNSCSWRTAWLAKGWLYIHVHCIIHTTKLMSMYLDILIEAVCTSSVRPKGLSPLIKVTTLPSCSLNWVSCRRCIRMLRNSWKLLKEKKMWGLIMSCDIYCVH